MSKPQQRRQFSNEQKVALLRRHLIDGVPVSQLCEEMSIQPGLFYHWQNVLFANAGRAFERPTAPARMAEKERQISMLEKRLASKNEVIAEISQEYVKLKKALGEP